MAYQQPSDNPIKHRFEGRERVDTAAYTVNVKDAFNLSYVYTMLHDWLVEEGWGKGEDYEFGETFYVQRENPNFGKEIWIKWRLKKTPADRSPFFMYYMDMDWKILGLKNTEINWKGQKVETNKGEFEIEVNAWVELAKAPGWDKWPFKNFKEVYLRRVLRQQLAIHKRSVYGDAYRMRDLIMNYMKMETFMPFKEAGEMYLKRTFE